MIECVEFLHNKIRVHNDIKLDNFRVKIDSNNLFQDLFPVLIDLGIVTEVKDDDKDV
jgi:serine/threonine protein kinase